jgi:hypothetical protein
VALGSGSSQSPHHVLPINTTKRFFAAGINLWDEHIPDRTLVVLSGRDILSPTDDMHKWLQEHTPAQVSTEQQQRQQQQQQLKSVRPQSEPNALSCIYLSHAQVAAGAHPSTGS